MKPRLAQGPVRAMIHFSTILFILLFLAVATGFKAPASLPPEAPPGMVYIPEGYFPMGQSSSGAEHERPLHFVFTSAFYIGKYEISNAQYREFVEATGHSEPAYWQDERFNPPSHPVVGVSWMDAMAYARWKGGRLPTEAEWEKAARGVDGRMYPWGGKWDKGFFFYFVNIYGEDDNFRHTAPVDYYQGGASPFGVFNLAGNVWEWCLDWYDKDYYRYSPERNPEGPQHGRMKILRGGAWTNDIDGVEVTRRARNLPTAKNEMYGFRIAQPIP